MKNYHTIQQGKADESNEVDALISRPIPADRSPSYKRYALVAVVALGFLLAYNLLGTAQDNVPNDVDAKLLGLCFSEDDDRCDPGEVCCMLGPIGKCKSCCNDADCVAKIEQPGLDFCVHDQCRECNHDVDCIAKIDQPPAGEFGKRFCLEDNYECSAYINGESSQIPSDAYPVWLQSETSDDNNVFRKLEMPRVVYNDGPLMEQVWHIDFKEQDPSFDKNKVEYNGTHITIPSYDFMHAAYSRSYNHYDEHETGISTLIMIDNEISMVADYPKLAFVEKLHTLTYDGIKDTTRADDIKKRAKEQLAANPVFDRMKWVQMAYPKVFWSTKQKAVLRQVESNLDQALTWQVRRYVRSYPEDDVGSVNPSSSDSWASHSKKAKQAIEYAKDPSFERDYLKSEQHCKHFEDLDGVSYTEDTITFPLGRPITGFTGEMVNAPVHYFGIGVGHINVHYDPSKEILEIFYQTFAHARQHSDVKYPGPYPNGLYVAPVTDGDDYAVDPNRDGRSDDYILTTPPLGIPGCGESCGEQDFTLWERPTSEVCRDKFLDKQFWEEIAVNQRPGKFDRFLQTPHRLFGAVGGMPCAGAWNRVDYGGGHGYDMQEIGVWMHALFEIPGNNTKPMLVADNWNEWDCFYADKNC